MSKYFLLADYKRAASAFVIPEQLLGQMWQNCQNAGRIPLVSYASLVAVLDLRAVVCDYAIVYRAAVSALAARGQDAMNEVFAGSLSYMVLNSVYWSGVQIGIYSTSHQVAVDPTVGWLLFVYPNSQQQDSLMYQGDTVKFFPLGVVV